MQFNEPDYNFPATAFDVVPSSFYCFSWSAIVSLSNVSDNRASFNFNLLFSSSYPLVTPLFLHDILLLRYYFLIFVCPLVHLFHQCDENNPYHF